MFGHRLYSYFIKLINAELTSDKQDAIYFLQSLLVARETFQSVYTSSFRGLLTITDIRSMLIRCIINIPYYLLFYSDFTQACTSMAGKESQDRDVLLAYSSCCKCNSIYSGPRISQEDNRDCRTERRSH